MTFGVLNVNKVMQEWNAYEARVRAECALLQGKQKQEKCRRDRIATPKKACRARASRPYGAFLERYPEVRKKRAELFDELWRIEEKLEHKKCCDPTLNVAPLKRQARAIRKQFDKLDAVRDGLFERANARCLAQTARVGRYVPSEVRVPFYAKKRMLREALERRQGLRW